MLDFPNHSLSSQESSQEDSSDTIISENMNTDDCLTLIIEATNSEKAGDINKAISIYHQVIEVDKEGTYKAIAQKALATLETATRENYHTENRDDIQSNIDDNNIKSVPLHKRLLKRFYDLPIQTKQLGVLLTSEIGSILTLVGVGAVLIVSNGRFQLVNQAKFELKVAEINYTLKIENMELTFDSQSNNLGIIEAAEKQKENVQVLTP